MAAVLLLGMLVVLGFVMGCKKPRIGWPLNIDVAWVALLFALMGRVLELLFEVKGDIVGRFKSLKIFLLLFCASVFLYRFNLPESLIDDFPKVAMSTGCYGNIIVFYACGLLGSLMVLCASLFLEKNAFLKEFGRETLACLLVHGVVMDVVWKVLGLMGFRIGIPILKIAACIIATIPVNVFLCYWCPNVIGKR